MGRSGSVLGEQKMLTNFWLQNLSGRHPLEDVDIAGNIISCMLEK
jgi:hypothetical protein